ncbi:hypothetical protein EA891_15480 [Salmonella enterica]|nr:hypothetical protein [Salmonella enterica]EHU0151765.1 hypothetical protein [Salmonella enterica subsp. enterica serovar Sandiego]
MTSYMRGKINFAIKRYQLRNRRDINAVLSSRREYFTALNYLADKAAEANMDEAFEKISQLLNDIDEGKEPELLEPEVAA